jgi:uncharacterized membrane protein YgdD (TMEM256/DUF423 family)
MRMILVTGAFCAMTAVILGAFAAHALKGSLSEHSLGVFQTGVQYQFYHSLALLLLAVIYRQSPQPMLLWSAGFMLAGILLFSGSLYLLALTQQKWFGPVTPLGGLCFIVAWLLLIMASIKMAE